MKCSSSCPSCLSCSGCSVCADGQVCQDCTKCEISTEKSCLGECGTGSALFVSCPCDASCDCKKQVTAAPSLGNFCCSCDDHDCCECCSEHQASTLVEKKRIKQILLDEIIAQHNMGSSSHLHAKQVLKHLLVKLNLG